MGPRSSNFKGSQQLLNFKGPQQLLSICGPGVHRHILTSIFASRICFNCMMIDKLCEKLKEQMKQGQCLWQEKCLVTWNKRYKWIEKIHLAVMPFLYYKQRKKKRCMKHAFSCVSQVILECPHALQVQEPQIQWGKSISYLWGLEAMVMWMGKRTLPKDG